MAQVPNRLAALNPGTYGASRENESRAGLPASPKKNFFLIFRFFDPCPLVS